MQTLWQRTSLRPWQWHTQTLPQIQQWTLQLVNWIGLGAISQSWNFKKTTIKKTNVIKPLNNWQRGANANIKTIFCQLHFCSNDFYFHLKKDTATILYHMEEPFPENISLNSIFSVGRKSISMIFIPKTPSLSIVLPPQETVNINSPFHI